MALAIIGVISTEIGNDEKHTRAETPFRHAIVCATPLRGAAMETE